MLGGRKQLRSLNRKIKGEDDYKQEADENLLRGNLCKEEKHKVQTGSFLQSQRNDRRYNLSLKELKDRIQVFKETKSRGRQRDEKMKIQARAVFSILGQTPSCPSWNLNKIKVEMFKRKATKNNKMKGEDSGCNQLMRDLNKFYKIEWGGEWVVKKTKT